MRVLIFGATGMVGQGVLRECLLAEDVSGVTAVGRTATGLQHSKLRELKHEHLLDYAALEQELAGVSASNAENSAVCGLNGTMALISGCIVG